MFIGPYDLSLSLGYPPPNPDPHPKVEEALQRILKAAHTAGKKWSVAFAYPMVPVSLTLMHILDDPVCSAMYCINGEQAAKRAKEGFDMASASVPTCVLRLST